MYSSMSPLPAAASIRPLCRVLSRFSPPKPSAGSDLGLSMVYGFLRQSGGNIRILSTPGEGTGVRFMLPRQKPLIEPPGSQRGDERTGARGGRLVLLAEDERVRRQVVCMQLAELGFAVLEVASGIRGMRCSKRVDGIELMTDMVMPSGIGGRELTRGRQEAAPVFPCC